MPVLFLLTAIVQVLFAMHAYRNGKDTFWIYIILIFPGLGPVIYFCCEVLPDIMHGRAAAKARGGLERVMNPEKEYKAAKYAFDTTPTVTNRIRLAQVLNARGDYEGVIALLEPALTNHFSEDPLLLEGLAYAYYDKGDYVNALKYIQKIYDRPDGQPQDYIRLLRCRALVLSGQTEQARRELEHLVQFFTGEEARIALAQLHEKMGNRPAARAIYQDIVTRSQHAPAYYRKTERQWIEMAERAL